MQRFIEREQQCDNIAGPSFKGTQFYRMDTKYTGTTQIARIECLCTYKTSIYSMTTRIGALGRLSNHNFF